LLLESFQLNHQLYNDDDDDNCNGYSDDNADNADVPILARPTTTPALETVAPGAYLIATVMIV